MTAVQVTPVLAELETRALADSTDRDAWLAARRGVITATEAKVLLTGTAAEKAKLLAEKVSGESSFSGNRYTENGNRREPFIQDWVKARFNIGPCGVLYVARENPRHAATPDGLGVNFDEELVLCEIKTSKHDVGPGTEKFARSGYYLQMQWQMYVTGARRVLYVWEQHNDDWSQWPEVSPAPLGEPRFEWIVYDEEMVARLIAAADAALAQLDEGLESEDPDDYAELVDEYFREMRLAEEHTTKANVAKAAIVARIGDRESASIKREGAWSISLSTPKPRTTFQQAQLKADHPDLFEAYMRTADVAGKPVLRITPAKEKETSE